jgi:AcrR family transcriptional regulator
VFNVDVAIRDLRGELIAAAVSLLAEPQRVAVPSLRRVAVACDVAPSAVYWHFPSEEDLQAVVLDVEYDSLMSAVGLATVDVDDPVAAFVAAWQAYATWGMAHPGTYQLLFEGGDALSAPRHDYHLRTWNRFVELARRVHPPAPLVLARLLWAAVHGIVSLRLHKTDIDWQPEIEVAVAAVVTAILDQRHRLSESTA